MNAMYYNIIKIINGDIIHFYNSPWKVKERQRKYRISSFFFQIFLSLNTRGLCLKTCVFHVIYLLLQFYWYDKYGFLLWQRRKTVTCFTLTHSALFQNNFIWILNPSRLESRHANAMGSTVHTTDMEKLPSSGYVITHCSL